MVEVQVMGMQALFNDVMDEFIKAEKDQEWKKWFSEIKIYFENNHSENLYNEMQKALNSRIDGFQGNEIDRYDLHDKLAVQMNLAILNHLKNTNKINHNNDAIIFLDTFLKEYKADISLGKVNPKLDRGQAIFAGALSYLNHHYPMPEYKPLLDDGLLKNFKSTEQNLFKEWQKEHMLLQKAKAQTASQSDAAHRAPPPPPPTSPPTPNTNEQQTPDTISQQRSRTQQAMHMAKHAQNVAKKMVSAPDTLKENYLQWEKGGDKQARREARDSAKQTGQKQNIAHPRIRTARKAATAVRDAVGDVAIGLQSGRKRKQVTMRDLVGEVYKKHKPFIDEYFIDGTKGVKNLVNALNDHGDLPKGDSPLLDLFARNGFEKGLKGMLDDLNQVILNNETHANQFFHAVDRAHQSGSSTHGKHLLKNMIRALAGDRLKDSKLTGMGIAERLAGYCSTIGTCLFFSGVAVLPGIAMMMGGKAIQSGLDSTLQVKAEKRAEILDDLRFLHDVYEKNNSRKENEPFKDLIKTVNEKNKEHREKEQQVYKDNKHFLRAMTSALTSTLGIEKPKMRNK